jgi:hypothetical protein
MVIKSERVIMPSKNQGARYGWHAMEYDLIRLFEHPLRFRNCIPSAVVTFGGQNVGRCAIQVQ